MKKEEAYRLPKVNAKSLRKMRESDVDSVNNLLNGWLKRYPVHLDLTADQTRHLFLPRRDIIESYVVDKDGVSDFISFYVIYVEAAHTKTGFKVGCGLIVGSSAILLRAHCHSAEGTGEDDAVQGQEAGRAHRLCP